MPTETKEKEISSVKPIDSYFTLEHQSHIAVKYTAKYSDADQEKHVAKWPEFKGNHFVLYILAETLNEAQKAVFSKNKKVLLSQLLGAMNGYSPTTPGAVLTDLQVALNKNTDLQLQGIYEFVPDDGQRIELLKDYQKGLKLGSKNGAELEKSKIKFFHASATLGIIPNTIWG